MGLRASRRGLGGMGCEGYVGLVYGEGDVKGVWVWFRGGLRASRRGLGWGLGCMGVV